MEVTRLAGALGAEVSGLDASRPLDVDAIQQLRAALRNHLVVVLRRQTLRPPQFEALCETLGELYVHPVFPGISEEHPAVLAVTNRGKKFDTNSHWHSDATFVARPPMATGT